MISTFSHNPRIRRKDYRKGGRKIAGRGRGGPAFSEKAIAASWGVMVEKKATSNAGTPGGGNMGGGARTGPGSKGGFHPPICVAWGLGDDTP